MLTISRTAYMQNVIYAGIQTILSFIIRNNIYNNFLDYNAFDPVLPEAKLERKRYNYSRRWKSLYHSLNTNGKIP